MGMAKRVTVTTEVTTEELHERSRHAANPIERTHWHILWLLKEGHTSDERASMLGYTARWIRPIVGRSNRAGEQAILDQRLTLPGAPCLLPIEQQKELDQALDQPPADGGLWSQDEHRIGLKPILRRVWARKGSRVRAVVRPRYQWMDLYGFVEPRSAETSWVLMPAVNTAAFSLALAAFAKSHRALGHTSRSSWSWIRLAGTRVAISQFPKDFICSFCRHIRLSCSQRNASGRSPMSRLPRGFSVPLMNCKTFKQHAAVGFKLTLRSFVGGPPFIGGLLSTRLKRI